MILSILRLFNENKADNIKLMLIEQRFCITRDG